MLYLRININIRVFVINCQTICNLFKKFTLLLFTIYDFINNLLTAFHYQNLKVKQHC